MKSACDCRVIGKLLFFSDKFVFPSFQVDKRSDHQPEFQRHLRNTWQTRSVLSWFLLFAHNYTEAKCQTLHCRMKLSHQNLMNSFFKRLMIWGLAAQPYQLQDGWLHLAKMCQTKGLTAGKKILQIVGNDNQPGDKVAYIR